MLCDIFFETARWCFTLFARHVWQARQFARTGGPSVPYKCHRPWWRHVVYKTGFAFSCFQKKCLSRICRGIPGGYLKTKQNNWNKGGYSIMMVMTMSMTLAGWKWEKHWRTWGLPSFTWPLPLHRVMSLYVAALMISSTYSQSILTWVSQLPPHPWPPKKDGSLMKSEPEALPNKIQCLSQW